MKLLDIVSRVGTAVLKDLVPGGAAIVDGINALLPDDKKLPADATGTQVAGAVGTLTPEQQSQVLMKEYDLQIAEVNSWSQVQGSLADADKAHASTRPQIAGWMAACVVFAVFMAVTAWAISIFTESPSMLKAVQQSWPLIVTIIGTPTFLLKTYFGARMKEKQSRYAAAMGKPAAPATNFIADVVNAIKG